jgi:hypothetical protein
MARLLFECQDSEGYCVWFETSEKEGKELAASYETSKRWLLDSGFILRKAREEKGKSREKVRFDGQHCPQCKGAVWDNREQKRDDPSKSKWPDFSCKDKQGCKWAVWPGQYEVAQSAA